MRPRCLDFCHKNLELIFAQGIVNSSSEINIPQLESAAELLVAHNPACTRAADKGSDWKPPKRFPYVQQVPEHILKFLATTLQALNMV